MKHVWKVWQPSPVLRGEICQLCGVAREVILAGGIWRSKYQIAPDEPFRRYKRAPRCKGPLRCGGGS